MMTNYIISPVTYHGYDNCSFDSFEQALQEMTEAMMKGGFSPVSIITDDDRLVCTYWNERVGQTLYVNHLATPDERTLAVANFKNVTVSIITDEVDELKVANKTYVVQNPNSGHPSLVSAPSAAHAAIYLINDQALEPEAGETVRVKQVHVEDISDSTEIDVYAEINKED